MTNYPTSIDNDRTIIRIDDNLSEFGTQAINQLRDAVFAIEKTLGINPQGSKSSVSDRISILLGPDGNARAEALQAIGLVTLPISNNQVGQNAGIQEAKLALSYSTIDLHTAITVAESQLELIQNLLSEENVNLLTHISGGVLLADNLTLARHVASHIDINAVPVDSRDVYSWTGLLDKNGNLRPAAQVAEALLEINNELVGHENSAALAHTAAAISVDASAFVQLPVTTQNVQDALDFIDNQETLSVGVDRATLNANGISRKAHIQDLASDGYTINVVPTTQVQAYLAELNQLAPHDNINNGDDVISFITTNTNFTFDNLFTNVKVGDIVRINYGYGVEAMLPIKSIRFVPGSSWSVRVASTNLFRADGYDGYFGYARIDRPNFNIDTWGVVAAAGVHPDTSISSNPRIDSVILGSPRGAVAVGIGFDANKIDSAHYLLYFRLYPNGNPSSFVDLAPIDVSGNAGATPGKYSLDIIVEETNKQFRKAGYNYRFIAFNHKGEFGVMLADSFGGAAFSIVSGQYAPPLSLVRGVYVRNVVGDSTDGNDALGLGGHRAGFATPVSIGTFASADAASNFSTLIIMPVSGRNVFVNGNRRDTLAKPRFTEGDGYWIATAGAVTGYPNAVKYTIPLDLATEGLNAGRTIVVQPIDPNNIDITAYGRFIIDNVSFTCGGAGETDITVINGVHGVGNPTLSGLPGQVKVYLSDDSVFFNLNNMVGDDPLGYNHYHEVFVNNLGKSVSVERARIPKSDSNTNTPGVPVGSGGVGGTGVAGLSGWNIRRVSPKLRGYSGSNFRNYIRLNVITYDSLTGEFEVYLSDFSSGNIGNIVKGKKNSIIRLYDNTFVNFIDIEFRDNVTSPGTTIPSGYTFIELFSSLIEDEEYFVVAGVSHNDKDFMSVTDLREFGTLSEENFTDSAIQFIEAGERYLHTNGIVRGFAFESVDATNSILTFSGGMALVNGAFIPVDSLNVKLPEVRSSATNIVEFFICVTKTGQLKAIVKDIGVEFFEVNNLYFVESLSFREIIDTKKDLTIIARVKVTVGDPGGFSSLSVTDARRHVINQDIGSFTWASTDETAGYNANFITADALMNWVNEYGITEVKVKTVTINSEMQLTFNNFVVLKGGTYEINSAKGLSFKSGNWKIENATINYHPHFDTSFSNYATTYPNDFFNTSAIGLTGTDGNWGAVLVDMTDLGWISNYGIDKSIFFSDSNKRPPFVGVYGNGSGFVGGRFTDNSFSDSATVDVGGIPSGIPDNNIPSTIALALAFINTDTDPGDDGQLFQDTLISGNSVDAQQGMIMTSRWVPDNLNAGQYLQRSRALVSNVAIKNNRFGYIGWMVEGNSANVAMSGSFFVQDNIAEIIYSGVSATANTFTTPYTYGIGVTDVPEFPVENIVTNNHASFLKADATSGNGFKSIVSGNVVVHSYAGMFLSIIPIPPLPNPFTPILMIVTSNDAGSIVCSDNQIDSNNQEGRAYGLITVGASYGITAWGCGGTFTGNVIKSIPTNGWGIYFFTPPILTEQPTVIVGNTLEHQSPFVLGSGGWIHAPNSIVRDNAFSHLIVDDQYIIPTGGIAFANAPPSTGIAYSTPTGPINLPAAQLTDVASNPVGFGPVSLLANDVVLGEVYLKVSVPAGTGNELFLTASVFENVGLGPEVVESYILFQFGPGIYNVVMPIHHVISANCDFSLNIYFGAVTINTGIITISNMYQSNPKWANLTIHRPRPSFG